MLVMKVYHWCGVRNEVVIRSTCYRKTKVSRTRSPAQMLIVTIRRRISALKYSACSLEILRTVVRLAESGVETALYDDIRDGRTRTSSGTGAVATVVSGVVPALTCSASPVG